MDSKHQIRWRVVGVVSCVKDGTDVGISYHTSSFSSCSHIAEASGLLGGGSSGLGGGNLLSGGGGGGLLCGGGDGLLGGEGFAIPLSVTRLPLKHGSRHEARGLAARQPSSARNGCKAAKPFRVWTRRSFRVSSLDTTLDLGAVVIESEWQREY